MSGEDIHTVASLLGLKDLRMAPRYQHLSPDYLTAAVNKLDMVFGHHSVTADQNLEIENELSNGYCLASRTGIEPVSPP